MNLHPAHAANRTRAIMLMFAELPTARTADAVRHQADVLERFTAPQRACWAQRSGMKGEPSDETWALLVEMARQRKPASAEPFERTARAS